MRVFAFKCPNLSLCVQSPNNTIYLVLQSMRRLRRSYVCLTGKIICSSIWYDWNNNRQNLMVRTVSLVVMDVIIIFG